MSAPQLDIFLSYSFQDREAVQAIALALKQRGLSVFLDRWYLIPGRSWPEVLEKALGECRAVAVFIGQSGLGRWQQREKDFALDRQTRDPAFPVIPILLPGSDPALSFLLLNTWIDLRNGIPDETVYSILVSAMRGEAPGPDNRAQVNNPVASICPYRGLHAFREEDSAMFFGREPYIPILERAVEQNAFVAVVGASGSGKSSLVRAGLIPKLRRGRRSQTWDVITCIPGDKPHHSLANEVLQLIEPELYGVARLAKVNELADHFINRTVTLSDVIKEASRREVGTERFLLFIDQWEELYTSGDDDLPVEEISPPKSKDTLRRLFIDQLLTAVQESPLSVVITFRGDFFGHVLSHRRLADRLQNSVVNIGPMNQEELRRTIVEPAKSVNLSFESGLVERILADLENEPGNLPLLEFALSELWDRQQRGQLSNAAYDDIGGVAGAIAQRAEQEFGKFSSNQQSRAEYVFTSLVRVARPDEGIDDTRQRVLLDELHWNEHSKRGPDVRAEVKALADARLLVTSRDGATGKVTVEVAHEALIRKWTRLREWVDKDRDGLRIHDRLRRAVDEWRTNERKGSFLYHGAHLSEALSWAKKNENKLSIDEKSFLDKSNRRRQIMWGGAIAAACFIILAAVIAIFMAMRERELKIEILRSSDELSLRGLSEELRNVWLDEKGMEGWLVRAESFSNPIDRHKGLNPELDERLQQFRFGPTGDMEMTRSYIEKLRRLKQKTIDEQQNAWTTAINEIADPSSKYKGMRLTPLEGLIPLGKDPNSLLEEFAVYLTGETPTRGPDGNLVLNADTALVLVLIPAGSFDMGSDTHEDIEKPVRNIQLDAFFISKYEMTQGQWLRVTHFNPSQFQDNNKNNANLTRPVDQVTWVDARKVLNHIKLNLPTEAQWEYAARAGTTGDWFAGESIEAEQAGCISEAQQKDAPKEPRDATCDVTYGKANAFGLFGVIGNVWEWCLEPQCRYDLPPEAHTGERKCERKQRVFRGGSFYSEPNNARSSLRRSYPPEFRNPNLGVRPAMRLTQPS